MILITPAIICAKVILIENESCIKSEIITFTKLSKVFLRKNFFDWSEIRSELLVLKKLHLESFKNQNKIITHSLLLLLLLLL